MKRMIGTVSAACLAAAGFAIPRSAFAQDIKAGVVQSPDTRLFVEVGGGVHDFVDELDNLTKPGASWDVRAGVHVWGPIGVEAAYFGAMNPLDLPGVTDDNADILTSSGEVLLRLEMNAKLDDNLEIGPYVAAGGLYQNMTITGQDDNALPVETAFQDSDDFGIPAAVGIQAYIGDRVTVGARGTYRLIMDEEFRTDRAKQDLQAWTAMARAGLVF